MAERIPQLAHQRRKLLLMLVGLLVDRSLRDADAALQARPERAEARLDLARPVHWKLPRQVQAVEAVRLHQRVRTVDEGDAAGTRLEQGCVARSRIGLLRLVIGAAADGQQDLQCGECVAQLRDQIVVAFAEVQVQVGIERLHLVRGSVDAGMAVHEMRAELQSGPQVVNVELAETWVEPWWNEKRLGYCVLDTAGSSENIKSPSKTYLSPIYQKFSPDS